MTLFSKTLLFISALSILCNLTVAHISLNREILKDNGGKQYSFNGQLIDHFNPTDKRTFAQRYWVEDSFYVSTPTSPIFLYICPEATCGGTPGPSSFVYQVAQKAGALFVALEHRYYGLSQPLGPNSMKTESLIYLTVEQALEDLAYFLNWFKSNYKTKIGDSQPWITIGGSYGGALSTWLRYKYPHLTAGAWSSSGAIKAILDFAEYDERNYWTLSKFASQCPQTLQKLNTYFEDQLYKTTPDVQQKFKARFGDRAVKLTHEELLYYIADTFVWKVQYGKGSEVCLFFANYTNFDELVNVTIKYIAGNNIVDSYGAYYIRNSTFDAEMEDKIGRQWLYQVCSQLGWFQTASTNQTLALRSQRININFFKQFCKDAFGKDLWPDVDRFNLDFGSVDFITTNIVSTLGCEDPWQSTCRNNTRGSMTSIYINCNGCAHCAEWFSTSSSDPLPLQEAHAQIEKLVLSYLRKSSPVSINI